MRRFPIREPHHPGIPACEPVCPVVAIFAEEDTPPHWDSYIDLNYENFEMSR